MIIRACRWLWRKMTGASKADDAGSSFGPYRYYPFSTLDPWPPKVPAPRPPHECPRDPCTCDLLSTSSKKGDRLTPIELDYIQADQCPDCKGEGFITGPSGGMSQNFYCKVGMCSSRFNSMGPFGIERISDASPGLGDEDARPYQ